MNGLTVPEARALRDQEAGPLLDAARDKLAGFIADDPFLPAVLDALRVADVRVSHRPGGDATVLCHYSSTEAATSVLVAEADGGPWWPHFVCDYHATRRRDGYGRPFRRYPLDEIRALLTDEAAPAGGI